MSRTRFLAALALAGLVACSPDDQDPFELDPTGKVEKPIGSSGGTVSTPAGLSLDVPSGAINSTTNISIQPTSGTGLGADINGDVIAGTAFEITPKGLELSQQAKVEITIPTNPSGGRTSLIAGGNGGVLQNSIATDEFSDLLNSLGFFIYVNAGSGKIEVAPKVHLDIDRKVITGWIKLLGTTAVGHTTPVTLRPQAEYNPTGGTIESGTYEFVCGILEANPCLGGLAASSGSSIGVFTDASVINRYPKIGAVITRAHGTLNFNAQAGTVSGSAVIKGVVQAVVGATVTSKEVTIEVVSGSAGSPSTVSYQTSGNQISFQTAKGWESFNYTATSTYLEFSLSEATIPLTDENGVERDYPISLVIRLQKAN